MRDIGRNFVEKSDVCDTHVNFKLLCLHYVIVFVNLVYHFIVFSFVLIEASQTFCVVFFPGLNNCQMADMANFIWGLFIYLFSEFTQSVFESFHLIMQQDLFLTFIFETLNWFVLNQVRIQSVY